MSKKKLAVFDIDDTFYHLKSTIQKALAIVTGKDIHHSQWHSFALHDVYGVKPEIVFEAFHLGDILNTGDVDLSIKDLLKHFKQANCDTLALTSRGWHNDAVNLTHKMLNEYGIVFDHVQVVPHNHSKGSVLKEKWEKNYSIDFFIDDYHKNLHGVKESVQGNPLIVVRNQPWNKNESFNDLHFKRVDELEKVIILHENHLSGKIIVEDKEIETLSNKIKRNKIKPR